MTRIGGQVDRDREIHAVEHDAGVRSGRPQHQVDTRPRVETYPGGLDGRLERALFQHGNPDQMARRVKGLARILAR